MLLWKDLWLEEAAQDLYPRAFSFSVNEDITVGSFLSTPTLAENFHIPISPEAMHEVREMQQQCFHLTLDSDEADHWVYPWGQKYTSSRYYQFCFRNVIPHEAYKWIWKSKCTPKIKIFCWLLFSNRLNTRNLLRRKHFVIQGSFNCPMCQQNVEETVEHLFFHCPFGAPCWEKLDITWGPQVNRLDLVAAAKRNHTKPMFMETFMLGAWSIWKERNDLIFNAKAPGTDSWKHRFIADFSLLVHRTKQDLHPFILDLVDQL